MGEEHLWGIQGGQKRKHVYDSYAETCEWHTCNLKLAAILEMLEELHAQVNELLGSPELIKSVLTLSSHLLYSHFL